MFIPRKPDPLGVMLKTLLNTASSIMLNAEIEERPDEDAEKEFNDKLGR